jgi:hypothetical protein
MRKIIKWCASSLVGHIVLFEALVSLPSFLALSLSNYQAGTLSTEWALWIALLSAIEGVVIAVPIWLLISRPRLLRMLSNNRWRGP